MLGSTCTGCRRRQRQAWQDQGLAPLHCWLLYVCWAPWLFACTVAGALFSLHICSRFGLPCRCCLSTEMCIQCASGCLHQLHSHMLCSERRFACVCKADLGCYSMRSQTFRMLLLHARLTDGRTGQKGAMAAGQLGGELKWPKDPLTQACAPCRADPAAHHAVTHH